MLTKQSNHFVHRWSFPSAAFEVFFALFLFAGVYKNTPISSIAPVNLTIVFMGLSGLAAIGLLVRRQLALQRPVLLFVGVFILFAVYALVSLTWSPNGPYAVDKTVKLFTTTAWALAGAVVIASSNERHLERFFDCTVAVAIAAVLVAIVNIPRPSTDLFGANYIVLGRVIGLATLIAAYRLWNRPNSWTESAGWGALLILFLFGLAVNGSRAALLTTILALGGLLILLVLRSKSIPGSPIGYFLGVIATTSLVAGFWIFGLVPRTIRRLMHISIDSGSSVGQRVDYWLDSVVAFRTSPVLGHGWGSWGVVTNNSGAPWPHNIILEVLVELGLVGLLLFGLVIAIPFVVNARRPSKTQALLLGLVLFMLLNALISADINGNRYLFAFLGLLLFARKSSTSTALGEH